MDSKLKFILILFIILVLSIISLIYYLLIYKSSNKLKKRITKFTKEKK